LEIFRRDLDWCWHHPLEATRDEVGAGFSSFWRLWWPPLAWLIVMF